MAPSLTVSISAVLMICTSFIVLVPLFYWLLTDARPAPSHR